MTKIIKVLNPLGGISGDMFVGAVYDADVIDHETLQSINTLTRLKDFSFETERRTNFGITGTKFDVISPENYPTSFHEQHTSFSSICSELAQVKLVDEVIDIAQSLFGIIAEAEAKIHSTNLENVHFHEIGGVDSFADILICAIAIHKLGKDDWYYSPLPVPTGTIKFSHGIVPALSPAASLILQDDFEFGNPTEEGHEGITPTGAALMRFLMPARQMPQMISGKNRRGIGLGQRSLRDRANALFLDLYTHDVVEEKVYTSDVVCKITFEVDDMTHEELARAAENVRKKANLLDLYQSSGIGKKGRCMEHVQILLKDFVEADLDTIFYNYSTIGCRVEYLGRYKLKREHSIENGMRVKTSFLPDGRVRKKIESDELLGLDLDQARNKS